MIREILEQNGIVILTSYSRPNQNSFIVRLETNDDENVLLHNEWFNPSGAYLEENEKTKLHNRHIEQACRQYVKENGFKMEWDSNLKEIYDLYGRNKDALIFAGFLNELEYANYYSTINNTRARKLIAWLYANDIKVVE